MGSTGVSTLLSALLGLRRARGARSARWLLGPGSAGRRAALLGGLGVAWGLWETARGARRAEPSALGPLAPRPPEPPAAAAEDLLALRALEIAAAVALCDGALDAAERETLARAAREAGLEPALERILARPRPFAAVAAEAGTREEREALYALACAVTAADDRTVGAERIALAQLASALALPSADARRIEREARDDDELEPEGEAPPPLGRT